MKSASKRALGQKRKGEVNARPAVGGKKERERRRGRQQHSVAPLGDPPLPFPFPRCQVQLPGAPSGQAAALRNGGRGKGGEGEKERGRAKGGGVGGRPNPARKIGDGDEWQPAGKKKGLERSISSVLWPREVVGGR